MLLRYSTHLAQGAGIRWNLGDPPIEGATDFLFMAFVAGAMKIFHTNAILTSRIALAVCHAADVVLVYAAARKLFGSGRPLALALAIYLMFGPGIALCNDGFSPTFYALAAMGAWWFACSMVVGQEKPLRVWSFALLSLVTGLIRPDGVFLAAFMTLALIFALITSGRKAAALRVLGVTVSVFLVLGGAYFLWRWRYFGYLLPNPFYRKGGGHLHFEAMRQSMVNVSKLILPTVPLGLLAQFKGEWRRSMFVFLPAALFSLVWVFLSNTNNAQMRFQYIALPVTLMAFPYVVDALRKRYPMAWNFGLSPAQRLAFAAISAVVLSGYYWKDLLFYPIGDLGSGAYNIASGLHRWKNQNYTIVVTEAGVIPYFSDWRAIDAFGLNDSVVTHDPQGLTEAYLEQNHPAILMMHLAADEAGIDGFARGWKAEPPATHDFSQAPVVMAHYAATHNFELAARWGDSPCNVHIWYVRRGLPQSQAMIDLIRTEPHFFMDSLMLAHNYMHSNPPERCSDPGIHIPINS